MSASRLPLRPLLFLCLLFSSLCLDAAPVEFSFRLPTTAADSPFARDIWTELETPDGGHIRAPAFYRGENLWSVRVRADQRGNYRFLGVSEIHGSTPAPLAFELHGKDRERVRDADPLGAAIAIDRRSGLNFVDGHGRFFQPLGGNLPWAAGDTTPESYYASAFATFRDAGLNWTRVWMCHWGRLNLDWVDPEHGEQPALGELDLTVARRLDAVIAAAETNGVRLQLVLQHHGQYSRSVNSNWDENPWNAARDGFLDTPADFFSDARARELTRHKFRYIVARWGYSSAIMAWELFNEAMWTDARRGDANTNTAVAAWHTEMARHLRRYDVHRHLVTTSDDDLLHPLWAAMDYYQPHLYANNMVLGVQALDLDPATLDRPVFYGEVGDDNMAALSDAQRTGGFVHPVLAWSGLFGAATQPAQIWSVETLRENGNLGALRSLAAFARSSGLMSQPFPRVSQPAVLGDTTASLYLPGGYYWHRGADPELTVPHDGRLPPELIAFRRILTNAAETHPYPNRATLHVTYPAAAVARIDLNRIGSRGGSLRVRVDEQIVVDRAWPAATAQRATPHDLTLPFRVGYGAHTITIENPSGPDWIDLKGIDLGIAVPALVAIARHGGDRVALWVHHRENLLSSADDDSLTPATGTVQLTDLSAGNWRVTWWAPASGKPIAVENVAHTDGVLPLDTPPVLRHLAAWLERIP